MKHRRFLALLLVLCLAATCVFPAAAVETLKNPETAKVQAMFNAYPVPGTAVPTAEAEEVIAVGTVVVDNTLNVRSGPGTSYSKVGTLPGGIRVAFYETKTVGSTTWGRMDLGWISMAYVVLDEDLEFTDAGYCSTSQEVLWGYAEDAKVLVIIGEGRMKNNAAPIDGTYSVPWADYMSKIKTVVVDYGVTYVGRNAFRECTSLRFAYVAESVTEIGWNAFASCSNLLDFYLPDTVTTVGEAAFENCTSLTYAWLPAGLTEMSNRVFYGCTALEAVVMPDAATAIGISAFEGCTSLTDIELAEGLTRVGESAFANCKSLPGIVLPKTLKYLDGGAFSGCTGLKEVVFCSNAPQFGTDPFAGVVADVYYPANNFTWTEDIRQNYGGTLTWYAIDIPGSENPVFSGECGENLTWTLADGVLTISGTGRMYDLGMGGTPWYNYKDTITQVVLNEGITYIGSGAFFRMPGLTEIAIPESVTAIGMNAFRESGLTAVTLPDSVTEIDELAFLDCTGLSSVTLSAGLTTIGRQAFSGCTGLKEITIPAQVKTIEVALFSGSGLEKITFLGDAPSIGNATFDSVVATAYYPAGNATWTADVMQDYGGTITWTPWGEVEVPDVTYTSVSLSMAGDIGLNYYVKLSDDIVSDTGAYMQFTFGDQVQTVPLSDALVGEDGSYRFSCAIPAKRMTDVVTGQMYTSAGAVGEAKEYSVKQYCTSMKNYVEENGLTGYDNLLNLLDAMLNYGGYSQLSFGYNTDNLANADLSEEAKALPETLDASAYAHSMSGAEEGITVYSASLLLESKTTIRFYFKLTGDRWIDDFGLTVDGQRARLTESGDLCYVDVPNVAAKDLDTMHTVTFDGGLTVSYCGLSYVNQMLTWSGAAEANVNTAKALYLYNQAANAYFGD